MNCAWGIEKIGYVLICYGVVDAVASVTCAPLVKYVGRITIFVFGAIINISTIIVMLTWTPDPKHPIMFFVVAGLWGLGDAIWQTQINGQYTLFFIPLSSCLVDTILIFMLFTIAFYGVLFPQDEEPSFSNYRLWESLGFIIAYIFSNVLCVNVKLYILLGVIVAGMTGYFAVEILERRKKKN